MPRTELLPQTFTATDTKREGYCSVRAILLHLGCESSSFPARLWLLNTCKLKTCRFFDRVTVLVDRGEAEEMISLYFSNAFDEVPHDILISKVGKCGLD